MWFLWTQGFGLNLWFHLLYFTLQITLLWFTIWKHLLSFPYWCKRLKRNRCRTCSFKPSIPTGIEWQEPVSWLMCNYELGNGWMDASSQITAAYHRWWVATMAGRCISITRHSDQVLAMSLTMGDNVPPRIHSGIFSKTLALTTTRPLHY